MSADTTAKATATIELKKDKDCKGSIRFVTSDDKAPIDNVYVSRSMPGINNATTVRVTIEIIN